MISKILPLALRWNTMGFFFYQTFIGLNGKSSTNCGCKPTQTLCKVRKVGNEYVRQHTLWKLANPPEVLHILHNHILGCCNVVPNLAHYYIMICKPPCVILTPALITSRHLLFITCRLNIIPISAMVRLSPYHHNHVAHAQRTIESHMFSQRH